MKYVQVAYGFHMWNHDPLVKTQFMQLIQDNPWNRDPLLSSMEPYYLLYELMKKIWCSAIKNTYILQMVFTCDNYDSGVKT